MKTTASLLRHLAAVAAFSALTLTGAQAQTTATTDPVGFITLSATGGGTAAAPKISLLSPTLTNPVSWQGAITGVSTAGGNTTISVSGTPWTAGQFNGANGSYYVEIVSTSPYSGTLSEITATTTGSITTFDNLTNLAAVGDTIKIRKDVTISDVFGATNSAGLLASSSDASSADEIVIYDGASAPQSYFYYTGPGLSAGWYGSTSFAAAGTTVVPLHAAIVIKRKTAGNLNFTFSGAVKTGNTLFPIQTGFNVLGTASASGLTLATSGLYTGSNTTGVVPSATDGTDGDQVLLYPPTGPVKTYFYYTGPGLAAGWYDINTFTSASTVAIAPGTAFVLKRIASAGAFNWTLPSPSSF